MSCSYVILYFFFFKQKTAYEMRISDWSSDVCSSDLNVVVAADYPDGAVGLQYAPRLLQPGMGEGVVSAQRIEFVPIIIDRIHAPALGPEQIAAEQIGRASCRERVCQYV